MLAFKEMFGGGRIWNNHHLSAWMCVFGQRCNLLEAFSREWVIQHFGEFCFLMQDLFSLLLVLQQLLDYGFDSLLGEAVVAFEYG